MLNLDLLTEEQAAQALCLTVATLRNWRSQRRGPAAVKIGRKVFYKRETIVNWIASREGARGAEAPKATQSSHGHGNGAGHALDR